MKKRLIGRAGPAATVGDHEARACADTSRHTCIEVFRDHNYVHYIPLECDGGLQVVTMNIKEFDDRFKELTGYPVERAARFYAEYATRSGASKEAMHQLAKLCNITDKEIEMATTKKASSAAAKAAKAATAKANSKTAPKPKVEPKATKTAPIKTAAKKPEAKSGEKRESAAQMFQDLIMEGKLTDEQIFAKVKAKYNLDDSKSGYVKWYRNHLTKQGKNPPAAK